MKAMKRLGTLIIACTVLGTVATAASRGEGKSKYFTVSGIVLQIDKTERTFLVADRDSNQKYLIEVPEGATFKIVFGKYMQMREPGFDDVNVRERIEIRCFRGNTEHLAFLEDGQPVIVVTAVQ